MIGPVMLDLEGLELTHEERDRLQDPVIGGLILFTRNFVSHSQVKELIASIRAVRPEPILISVDHEGGRVQRFKTGFSVLPAMGVLGELYFEDPILALSVAEDIGTVLAYELLEIGIDFSFTPVLDLNFGRSHVIGERAFGRWPQTVIRLAEALIRGLEGVGSHAIGKHFPGHGYVEADSHHDLPVDERPYEEIAEEDLEPFRVLSTKLAGIMPAHVLYSACDSHPAGFSSFWLHEVLRGSLHFDGAILSDDLAMAGAHAAGSPVQRAKAAFGAGCDMVLLCNDPASHEAFLQGLNTLELPGSVSQARLERLRGSLSSDAAVRYQSAQKRLSDIVLEGYHAR